MFHTCSTKSLVLQTGFTALQTLKSAVVLGMHRGRFTKKSTFTTYAQDFVDAGITFCSEIKRDINRTFPEHPLFQEEDGPGQRALLNVMKAYAVSTSPCRLILFLVHRFFWVRAEFLLAGPGS
jgi:hypothetical protein